MYKTLHNMNPVFMKNYFLPKPTSYYLRRSDVLSIPKVKTTDYSIKSTSFFGPKIWNPLPNEMKQCSNAMQQCKSIQNSQKTSFSKTNAPETFAMNMFHNAILLFVSEVLTHTIVKLTVNKVLLTLSFLLVN